MDSTPLILGLRKYFFHSLQHPHTLVSHNELYSIQPSFPEPLEKADPTGFILFHPFGSAQNFAISILIHGNRHKNGHIFVFSAPVSLEVDPVHIHIRVLAALKRSVPPGFDIDIGFLVQFADGRSGHLAAPEGLGDVLYPADRYTGQVHLDEGFFHTALPAAVTLDDGCLEGNTFQPGHMKGHVPGGGSQLSVIVAASITLTGLAALIPGSLGQLLGFGFQQLVQGFLHAATDQFLDLPLDYFLVELYNVVGHGLSSPFRMCVATSFYQRPASRVYFFCYFQFAQFIIPYLSGGGWGR